MNRVIYCCDTETTGLDADKNDVIEVSFWRSSDNDQKTWFLTPLAPMNIEDKALKINGHKKEDILHKTAKGRETYREPDEVLAEIECWIMTDGVAIEDRVFMGQNPDFDLNFLRKTWAKVGCEDTFPFGRMYLDTIQLATFIDVCLDKKRPYYNLSALVKDFGITKLKAHRAEDDVKMTRDLFMKIMDSLKPAIIEAFG